VLRALEQLDVAGARLAWQGFGAEFPGDQTLPLLGRLIDALGCRDGEPLADHAAVQEQRAQLAEHVEPAARRLFGEAAAAPWMHVLWQALARRASHLPFIAECSEEHAAALWLRGTRWVAAAEAVAAIESWRRIPAPLSWMAEARCRIDGIDPAWPLLAELAWLAPSRFGGLCKRLADPLLNRLLKAFGSQFEGSGGVADLAWFPAWVLTEKAALAGLLGPAQPGLQTAPERAMRLLLDLLALEKQGRHHDLIERRKQLRGLSGPLYAAYMKTR
jgi:hypothetical protein